MKKIQFNLIINFSYQILQLVFPLITMPYLSRVLGVSGIGLYSFVISTTKIFSNFILLGLPKYGSREIAFFQNDKEARSSLFSNLYFFQIVSFLICTIIYVLLIVFNDYEKKALIFGIPILFSSLFNISWYFWGVEKFKITVPILLVTKILNVICIFLFIKRSDDVYKYIFIYSLLTFFSQFLLFPFLKNEIFFRMVILQECKKHIKPIFQLFIPVIAISIYKLMDKVMLGILSNVTEVGFYECAEKVITIPEAIISAIGVTMLPRIVALTEQGNNKQVDTYFQKTFNLVLISTLLFFFGFIGAGEDFVCLFYGNDYDAVTSILQLLGVSIIFVGCGDVLRTQYLIPNKKDKVYLFSAIIGAVSNLTLNLIFIPLLGAKGAAIGTVFAEASVFLYQFVFSRKQVKMISLVITLITFSLAGLLMIAIMDVIKINSSLIINFLVKVFVGTLFYVCIYFLFNYINKKIIK